VDLHGFTVFFALRIYKVMTRNKESQELGLSENIPPNPLVLTSLDDLFFVFLGGDQPDQPKNTNPVSIES
jgi:hypothetical protein